MSDIQDECIHNGIDCYIAYASTLRSRHDILNGYQIGNWFDHKLHALLSRIFRKQAYFSTLTTWRFLRYIDQIKPDVVHLHVIHSNFIKLNMLLRHLAKRNIATVATLHDNWFYTGGCTYYPRLKCNLWQTNCDPCPLQQVGYKRYLKNTAPQVLAERAQYFNAIPRLTFVGVSDWISSECRKSLVGSNNVLTIRNGVRPEVFRPMTQHARQSTRNDFFKQHNIRTDTDTPFIILGPASKWLDSHNAEGFKYIISRLKPDEVFVIYGCDDSQMSSCCDPKRHIVFVPYIHNKAVLSTIYSIADVFVNCTYEDTCSFINLESQACGTPIITFDNTGARECVNNICSFHVPTDDYHSMYQKIQDIKQLWSKSDSKRPYQEACVRWIHEHFTMQSNYRQYVQLYQQCIQSR